MSLKQKTILVVDDDQDILKLLNKILSGAGFTVIEASNPEDGRKLLADNPPHVIISDLHMEPEDGFAFIRSIKMNKQYSHIPILVLSALNDFGSVKKAIALGVNDYVIKPLQAPMLIRKLRKALFNKDFIKWDAPLGLEPLMTAEFPAEVIAIGETGYSLAGPFKLTANKDLKVDFPEFKDMHIEKCHQRTTDMVRSHHPVGNFLNDVTFVGMDEESAQKIRQLSIKRAVP